MIILHNAKEHCLKCNNLYQSFIFHNVYDTIFRGAEFYIYAINDMFNVQYIHTYFKYKHLNKVFIHHDTCLNWTVLIFYIFKKQNILYFMISRACQEHII